MEIEHSPRVGSHMPMLMKIVNMTSGPVLELGMGMSSTPFLHWACFPNRKLVSYEADADFLNSFKEYASNFHEIKLAEDWDKIDILGHWSVVLVDHLPRERRKEEVKRLANSADYVIIHDSEGLRNKHYRYTEIFPLFKQRFTYMGARPYTTVLSNFKDLSNLQI
jgi:hypothetical protein